MPHACLAAYAALGHVGRLIQKRHKADKKVFILGGKTTPLVQRISGRRSLITRHFLSPAPLTERPASHTPSL